MGENLCRTPSITADTSEGRSRAQKRGQKMGRPFTDHQKREAIKRRNQGETLADIARSYNVSPATISSYRRAAWHFQIPPSHSLW
jgi:DNA invertase Pin-like site-specific DNA recombinase